MNVTKNIFKVLKGSFAKFWSKNFQVLYSLTTLINLMILFGQHLMVLGEAVMPLLIKFTLQPLSCTTTGKTKEVYSHVFIIWMRKGLKLSNSAMWLIYWENWITKEIWKWYLSVFLCLSNLKSEISRGKQIGKQLHKLN